MTSAHTKLEFLSLESQNADSLAILTLNRPEQANAFSAQMMEEITFHIDTVARQENCRGLVIAGSGKHFSAGADLSWMKASASLTFQENINDSEKLTNMFEAVYNLGVPTVAVVQGAIYGGAVGLLACCDFAIAHEKAKFCLSETRLGLLPAVISPYLARKITIGQLKRHAFTGRVFSAQEALSFGLIEVVAGEDINDVVKTEINSLLACGPQAVKSFKTLLEKVRGDQFPQSDATQHAISLARTSTEGQAGLASFFAKTKSPWHSSLADSFTLIETRI